MADKVLIGVDEAGRGPVIGPLVVVGIKANKEEYERLKVLGIKDSKLLSPKKREELFIKIKEITSSYEIIIIKADEIDEALNNPDYNLNLLEEDNMIKIIKKLYKKGEKGEAYIDCPTPKTSTLKDYMEKNINKDLLVDIKLFPEHKADLNHTIVGAASILAKVTRDDEIEKLKEIYGDFGSGYPADPKTKEFLKKNLKLDIYRKTWSTYKNAVGDKLQKKIFDF